MDIGNRLLRIIARTVRPTCPSCIIVLVSSVWLDRGGWRGIEVKAVSLESRLEVSRGRYLVVMGQDGR